MQSFYPNNIAELLSCGEILFFLHLYLTAGVVQCEFSPANDERPSELGLRTFQSEVK